MKYCHNCGAPLVDDVRFCTACGSPLDPPETEPAMPEPAVMPEMPEPAPEMPVMPGEALPPEPPKKRKKRIWLWILLPVVVLALAAGALYYFLVWNAPEARVQRAWQKTAAALETEVGRPEKLMAFAETLRGPLSEQRALTATLAFESNGETLAAELYSQRDNATRRLGGTAELTVPWGEGTLPISFYGDAEELQLTLPGITDEVYSIPAHGIAEAYADSALGEMLGELDSLEDLDLFPEETARDPALSADLQDKLRTFGDSLKVTKAGTSVLTLDGRSVPVTNYDIDFSKKQLTRLCRAFCDAYEIDFTVNMGVKMSTDTVIGELIDSVRTPLHVSVDGDGMVRAWEMTTRESGTDTTVRILLAGEENPWNRIEVWTAEDDAEPEILFVCGLSGLDGVLTLAVGDETGSYGLQLVLDDAAQSLTARLSTGFGAEKLDLLTMNYGTEDGGAQLGVTLDLPDQLDAKATLDLHWAALETQPEALSDSPVGLFDLSEDELTALEKSIGAQIARLLYGGDMTAGETDAVLTGTWKAQVDLTPDLLDALNDALGLDLQMDDPTVMTMLVTFEEDGSYHMDYDAKALREELNALEDALCEKYPDQEALLKQAFAGLQLDVDGSSGTYTASNGILYLTQSGEDWEDILYYSVEDNKLYLTPPQDEESGDWGGMFGSEYPMVFERVD